MGLIKTPVYFKNWLKMSLSTKIPKKKGDASENSKRARMLVSEGKKKKKTNNLRRNNRAKIQFLEKCWEKIKILI